MRQAWHEGCSCPLNAYYLRKGEIPTTTAGISSGVGSGLPSKTSSDNEGSTQETKKFAVPHLRLPRDPPVAAQTSVLVGVVYCLALSISFERCQPSSRRGADPGINYQCTLQGNVDSLIMKGNSQSSIPWTIGTTLEWTTGYFAQKGIVSPRLDAEVLLAHALGVERLYLYLNRDRPLSSAERERYRSLVGRRARREPLALITGTKEFWSIPFRIVPGVLIPRPETELLVEVVEAQIKDLPSPALLEIGTGSGAVAVAVARECPRAHILATDIDLPALKTAAGNARNAGVAEAIGFIASNFFAALRPGPMFDVICSNPPYVPSGVIDTLEPEIVNFEPHRALDGGPDGLDVIQLLTVDAGRFLKEHGALILEIGDDQEESVKEILSLQGAFSNIQIFRDLSGKPRVVKGRL